MDNEIKAVAFDIDGTLSPGISWTKLTFILGSSVENHAQIHKDFKEGKLEYEESKKALLGLWRSQGPITKEKLIDIFNNWEIKPDAKELFDYLHSKNYRTCLITGSFDLFAEIIAKRLGAEAWYANTTLYWDENNNLHDYDYVREANNKKLEQLKEFCRANYLQISECVAVGDDSNDTDLFKATERGILVESPTSYKLESVAWKCIKHLSEIKQIL